MTIAVFKLLLKHMKNKYGGEKTHSFFIKHTFAVHFVKKLFQCDICDLLFSSYYLKHMKNKHGGEKPHCFSQNTHYQFIESIPM